MDDSNRGPYEAAGMTALKRYADKPMTMPYYQVPAGVIEDGAELVAWARASVLVGRSTRPTRRKGRP